ncbi:unnamed protein product [Eruca vesicaria subsp. sativa]|uniref:Uncharacterized protein n=1 Tax=Eruca vesicaria subsp. sativa TaxID=29727 RepID=A0ABC8JTC7_ERUVS|nr:unnamed protein product [Eruca vesicaria subsp. sativa]
MEDRYPKWGEDKPPDDLDNMIVDILSDQLNDKFWDEESHTDMPIQKLLEAVNNLTGRVETMDVSVAERVIKTLEASVQAQMDARMALFETELKKKMAILEEDINVLKGKDDEKVTSNAGKSKEHEEDDACSNTMVCLHCYLLFFMYKILTGVLYLTVMDGSDKKGSVDGLPIQRVVKKEKNKKTVPGIQVKIEKPFPIPQLNDQSISAESCEDHLQWQKSTNCRQALEAIASSIEAISIGRSKGVKRGVHTVYEENSGEPESCELAAVIPDRQGFATWRTLIR